MGESDSTKPEVVTTKKESETALALRTMLNSTSLTATRVLAITHLTSASTPENAIQTHPGKGGKTMKYLNHVWVSRQLNEAFGQMWGMELSNPTVWADGSATVMVRLYVDFPHPDGSVYRRTVTEIGAFDGGGGSMSKAMMIASAASRGLVKCCFRAFRLGEDLYTDVPEPTLSGAWAELKKYGKKRKINEEQIIEILKKKGITKQTILDRYVEAWKAIYDASIDQGEIPEF